MNQKNINRQNRPMLTVKPYFFSVQPHKFKKVKSEEQTISETDYNFIFIF